MITNQMYIKDLYDEINRIFADYTTHQWKNGWEHEGNRKSKELTIQERIPWNNIFLLELSNGNSIGGGFILDGPNRFRIEVKYRLPDQLNIIRIRIDIESRQMSDVDIHYFVTSELDWIATKDFIIKLCQSVYDANIKLREAISMIPSNIYGVDNPSFTKPYRRDILLNKLGI